MLINKSKKIEEGDVIGILTIGGSEALCKVESINDTEIEVKDFRMLVFGANGSMSLMARPLTAKQGQSIKLLKSSVTMIFTPQDEIVKEYKEAVSNIVLPGTGGIIS